MVIKNGSWKLASVLTATALACGIGGVVGPAHALAGDEDEVHTCTGTFKNPGVLAGSFDSVVVRGWCAVNGGVARVEEDLTVAKGGVLAAVFGLNHRTGSGSSKLIVEGDLSVRDGGTAFIGCGGPESPCLDEPNPSSPTLSSPGFVGDDLDVDKALGVVMHNSTIGGDLEQRGGGGGVTCAPSGAFAKIGAPVFSVYEDTVIHGEVEIHGLQSCWLGVIRDRIGDDVSINNNQLADPDAIEIFGNHIDGDLSCHGNSMTWDGYDVTENLFPRVNVPNKVEDERSGQCSRSTPTTQGGAYGPPGSF